MPHPHLPLPASGLRTVAATVFAHGIQQGGGLILGVVAARQLGLEVYGVYALAVVFAELLVLVAHTGLYPYLVTAKDTESKLLDTIFWLMSAFGLGLSLALWMGAPLLSDLFEAPDLTRLLRAFAVLHLPAIYVAWASAVLTRRGQMTRHARSVRNSAAVALGVGLIALWVWPALWALVLYRAIRTGAEALFFTGAVETLPSLRFDRRIARAALSFSKGLYGARLVGFIGLYAADLLLAYRFSTAESGAYRLASRIALGTVDLVAQPLRHLSLRALTRPDRPSAAGDCLAALLLGSGAMAVLVWSGLPVLGPVLLGAEAQTVLGIVPLLLIIATLRFAPSLIEPVCAAAQQTRIAFAVSLAATAAMLFGLALSVPHGLHAVVVTQVIVQTALCVLALWIITRMSRLSTLQVGGRIAAIGAGLAGVAGLMAALSGYAVAPVIIGIALLGSGWLALRCGLVSLRPFGDVQG